MGLFELKYYSACTLNIGDCLGFNRTHWLLETNPGGWTKLLTSSQNPTTTVRFARRDLHVGNLSVVCTGETEHKNVCKGYTILNCMFPVDAVFSFPAWLNSCSELCRLCKVFCLEFLRISEVAGSSGLTENRRSRIFSRAFGKLFSTLAQ